jgi:hypothetical protein
MFLHNFIRFVVLMAFFSLSAFSVFSAPIKHFLPEKQQYSASVPTPESVLGFGLGERHARHDQLLSYFKNLADSSNCVVLTDIGKTPQLRKQFLVTISSPENLKNLDQILNKRHIPFAETHDPSIKQQEPLVVWLGYSVHGDEASGANAAMAVAYHYAASKNKNIEQLLAQTIIVLEPIINPDGLDRFVNWVNNFRGINANDDPNHIEHHQSWITGRTNHFSFDLNRDWLLLTQQESRHRLAYYHLYQPHVLGDFHEMDRNSSYFFQPGIATRNHPLTPKANTKLTQAIATYHAKALDQENRLYYSEESFDDFYYGKGSTYPDINGSIGILFEQASSRGFQQQSINGLLTFEFGIKNHVLTSLSTVEGAWQNREQLKQYRHDFYRQAIKLANKEKFTGYLIQSSDDDYRLTRFLSNLRQHQINVFPLKTDFRHNNEVFPKENSYFIPLKQAQFRLIQALFNQQTDFNDNTFYDVSGWTLPLAMNIKFHQVERTWGLKLAKESWQQPTKTAGATEITESKKANSLDAYAYIFSWQDSLAPKMLNQLLNAGIKARVATKAFTAEVDGQIEKFTQGSILLAAAWQDVDNWQQLLFKTSKENGIKVTSLHTGLTPLGVDLGSRSFKVIKPIKVLMVGGKGVSQYEAGEIRYYLDQILAIPVSVVEQQRLQKLDFSSYSHVILVDGNYKSLPEKGFKKLAAWVKQGGVVFAQKRAAQWLSEKELLQVDFVSKNQLDQLFETDGFRYQEKEKLAARKRIAGAIFATKLDTSHPLTYGYKSNELAFFRNSTLIMKRPNVPFITVASYTSTPLMSGYTDRNLVNTIAHNAALVAHNHGKGRIIASSDDLAFRGYWLGSARILANSLFFAKAFSAEGKPSH